MKRIVITFAAIILLCAALAGCASAKLAEVFKKDDVVAAAKHVVEVTNTLDYDAVVKLLRTDLQAQVTAQQLKDGWDSKLQSIGAFQSFDSVTVVGQNKQGVDYAVAVVVAKYEKGNAIFTLSFDTDMQLAGLYMK